jgi:alpha-L-arabinofuranosidase
VMSHRLNALEALCDSSFEDRRMLLEEAWMKPIACLLCIVTALSVVNSDASGQLLPDNTGESNRRMEEISNQNNSRPMSVPKETKVIVDADKPRGVLMPWTLGVESLVSDNHLTDPDVLAELRAAGITTLRYPGGRIADTFHWSTYSPSNWQGLDHPNVGYAPAANLGSFLRFMEQVGTAVFTINYGSNLHGTGGGEPAEAAAWVAYVNGNPSDTKSIGRDSAGNDWQTVGYWASLRASPPLGTDDGRNFLRIQHAAPFQIHFWEVGNQVFQNGYYGGEGLEEDAHAPYPQKSTDNERSRKKNQELSPAAYAKNFLEFARAMKAVDPKIHLGVPLNPSVNSQINRQEWTKDPVTGKYVNETSVSVDKDFGFATDWAKGILPSTCNEVDFVSVPLYAGDATADSNWKDLDNYKLLTAPQGTLAQTLASVADAIQKSCGQRARNIRVAITEMAPVPWAKVTEPVAVGLFAADVYLTLAEFGVINVDWADLHSGAFLDDHNKPGPAYFGTQLVFALMNFNDAILNSSSSSPMLSVHASKRADGSVGIMVINKDPKNATTVKVALRGMAPAAKGARFDYGKTNPPEGNSIVGKQMDGLGTSFSIPMPPYTATVILIPKAK